MEDKPLDLPALFLYIFSPFGLSTGRYTAFNTMIGAQGDLLEPLDTICLDQR